VGGGLPGAAGRRARLRRRAAAAVGLAVLVLAGRELVCGLAAGDRPWCAWVPHLPLDRLDGFIRGAGPWAAAASVGLMVLHSLVPFPAELLSMANGAVFGIARGIAVTWVGAMLGAFLAFFLARRLGRPFLMQLLSPRHQYRLEELAGRLGPEALLLGRFVPAISFNLMNYAAGLTPVSWRTFAWTTGVGILPLTVLMAVLGHRLETGTWRTWALAAAAALLVWLPAHLLLRARRRHEGDGGPTAV